jgi:hypothetical protein
VGIALLEGHKLTKLKVLDARIAVSANDRQRRRGLHIDQMIEGPGETTAKGVSAGVVMKS